MSAPRKVVFRNAVANLLRPATGGLVALILPPVLTRNLSPDRFSAWVLLLQVASYAYFLDFGLQTAVSRFVARTTEVKDWQGRNAYLSSSVTLLFLAGMLGFVVVSGVNVFVPHLFSQAPTTLLPEFRLGLEIMAATIAVTLPTSAFAGAFVGLNQTEYAALYSSGSRLLGALLLVAAIHWTHSLVVMAILMGASNLLGGILLYVHLRRAIPDMHLGWRLVERPILNEVIRFCIGLSILNVSVFLVNGLDLTIVGHFRFHDVAFYAIASNVVLLMAGLGSAGASALIAPLTAIHARGSAAELGAAILRYTRLISIGTIVLCCMFTVCGHLLFRLWLGEQYADSSTPIMTILVLATAIRVMTAPYISGLIAAGRQTQASLAPIAEGIVNVVLSVVLASHWGGMGVAFGTLAGSFVGLALQLCYNMPRITDVGVVSGAFLRRTILEPLLLCSPLLFAAVAWELFPHASLMYRLAAVVLCAAVTAMLLTMDAKKKQPH